MIWCVTANKLTYLQHKANHSGVLTQELTYTCGNVLNVIFVIQNFTETNFTVRSYVFGTPYIFTNN